MSDLSRSRQCHPPLQRMWNFVWKPWTPPPSAIDGCSAAEAVVRVYHHQAIDAAMESRRQGVCTGHSYPTSRSRTLTVNFRFLATLRTPPESESCHTSKADPRKEKQTAYVQLYPTSKTSVEHSCCCYSPRDIGRSNVRMGRWTFLRNNLLLFIIFIIDFSTFMCLKTFCSFGCVTLSIQYCD